MDVERTGQFASQPVGYAVGFQSDCSWLLNYSFAEVTNFTNYSKAPVPAPTYSRKPTPPRPTSSPSKSNSPSEMPTVLPTMASASRRPSTQPTMLPTRVPDELTGVRLFFHEFDLEPSSLFSNDRVEIYFGAMKQENFTLSNNLGQCSIDPDCSSVCPTDVGCRCRNSTCVPRVVHLSDPKGLVRVRLVTDRNDRGVERRGINVTWIGVESCLKALPNSPPSKDGCRKAGGVCNSGYCFNTAEIGPWSRAFSCDCNPDYSCPAGQFFLYNASEARRHCHPCPAGTYSSSAGVREKIRRSNLSHGRIVDELKCVIH